MTKYQSAKDAFRREWSDLTPIQRASADMFGEPDYWGDRSLEENTTYWNMWGSRMTMKELAKYYGHREG